MKVLPSIRWIAAIGAFLTLVGGYAAQQLSFITGNIARYEEVAMTPNLVLGWILLIVTVVLSLVKDAWSESEA